MPSTLERFEAKYDPEPNTGCWIWTASLFKPDGYGQFFLAGEVIGAHRASWMLHRGPIPAGLNMLHHCDVMPCVNPDHLFLGTLSDNAADMHHKKRHPHSSASHCPSGHPYDALNTRWYRGRRYCRECHRQEYWKDKYPRQEAKP